MNDVFKLRSDVYVFLKSLKYVVRNIDLKQTNKRSFFNHVSLEFTAYSRFFNENLKSNSIPNVRFVNDFYLAHRKVVFFFYTYWFDTGF